MGMCPRYPSRTARDEKIKTLKEKSDLKIFGFVLVCRLPPLLGAVKYQ